jgi:hypothetical protein
LQPFDTQAAWTDFSDRHFAEARMSTKPWNWKPREVSRAIAVARKAGLVVTGITICNGEIRIATGASSTAGNDSDRTANPWDTDHAANEKRLT